jgi:hypothetical protein
MGLDADAKVFSPDALEFPTVGGLEREEDSVPVEIGEEGRVECDRFVLGPVGTRRQEDRMAGFRPPKSHA